MNIYNPKNSQIMLIEGMEALFESNLSTFLDRALALRLTRTLSWDFLGLSRELGEGSNNNIVLFRNVFKIDTSALCDFAGYTVIWIFVFVIRSSHEIMHPGPNIYE